MSRRLRIFALVMSLTLLAVVLIGFAASYLPEGRAIRSYKGKLVLICAGTRFAHWVEPTRDDYRSTPFIIDYAQRSAKANNKPNGKFMGIEWLGVDFKSDSPCVLMVSYWYLAAPLAAISIWCGFAMRRRKSREMAGHCRGCGYDLRASQDKCPECGTAVSDESGSLATSTSATR